MKKYLVEIFCFILIPLILVCLTEISIAAFRNNLLVEKNLQRIFADNSESHKWVDEVDADTLVILAGSSSVRYGLSCSILNELSHNKYAYVNVAMDASDPVENYFIIKEMNTERVSAIYFGLDPVIYTKRYYMYRPHAFYLDFCFTEVINFYWEHDKKAFIKRYMGLVKCVLIKHKTSPNHKKPKIPVDFGSEVVETVAQNFNKPISDFFQIEKYGWSDLQFDYLKKLSKLCAERNIKLILFIPPKRSDFCKDYRINLREVHLDYIARLQKLGIRIPIFGKFDQLSKVGDDDNFAEAFHLNKNGQLKYSKIFYEMTLSDNNTFSENYDWFLHED